MSIVPTVGNLLATKADAYVNPVNCVGVMGKGLALQFKDAFPDNFRQYKMACSEGGVKPGRILVVHNRNPGSPVHIFNFPTKDHWKNPSRIEWIKAGLEDLVELVKALKVQSIAIPALGCGNGQLTWQEVKPLIEAAFAELPEVTVYLFEPLS